MNSPYEREKVKQIVRIVRRVWGRQVMTKAAATQWWVDLPDEIKEQVMLAHTKGRLEQTVRRLKWQEENQNHPSNV